MKEKILEILKRKSYYSFRMSKDIIDENDFEYLAQEIADGLGEATTGSETGKPQISEVYDVTKFVEFGPNDDDMLPLDKCVCGKRYNRWDFVLDTCDWSKCECGRELIFSVGVTVYSRTPPVCERVAEWRHRAKDQASPTG